MPIKQYFRPTSLGEAFRLLTSFSGRILAGGTDLLIQEGVESIPETAVVSLKDVRELKQIEKRKEGDIFVGAMVRHAEVTQSHWVNQYFPALVKASHWVGSPSIRNLATIGGNICNASPSADTAPPLLAYGAKAIIVSPSGEKTINVEDFFTGPSMNVLGRGEILKGFLLTPQQGWIADYEKLGLRKAMEIAIVNVCVAMQMEDMRCSGIRIALGAVAPTPIRAKKAESILKDKKVTPELIGRCAEAAVEETKPISDIRASADYRKEMVRFLVRKMLSNLARAG
ncbi:MAG: FAD binding domain-containing protein [Thermodesulfobacteriota bacterium]